MRSINLRRSRCEYQEAPEAPAAGSSSRIQTAGDIDLP